jgi:6-phosphogluconolactonase
MLNGDLVREFVRGAREDRRVTPGIQPGAPSQQSGGDHLFVANQESDNVLIFEIDKDTGHLTATGQILEVPSPVCVKLVAIE